MQPCWPHLLCHPISMVYIDTLDPICNHADLVYHVTQQYGVYRHIRPNMQPCWPRLSCHPISSNPTSWCCNQSIQLEYDPVPRRLITIQALIGNVTCVCLCRCTNMYIIHQIVITVNSHQAYIIVLTQYLNIYITHQNITK